MLLGCAQAEPSRPIQPDERPIAHASHDGINFSVSIAREDTNDLAIMVFETSQTSAAAPPIGVKVVWRDDTLNEGLAAPQASAGNAGMMFWRYRFDTGRVISLADIAVITIEINKEVFSVYPWGEAPLRH